jgi:DNA segregation ATPase FtsK/SpoIIIE, S-DNA-T family
VAERLPGTGRLVRGADGRWQLEVVPDPPPDEADGAAGGAPGGAPGGTPEPAPDPTPEPAASTGPPGAVVRRPDGRWVRVAPPADGDRTAASTGPAPRAPAAPAAPAGPQAGQPAAASRDTDPADAGRSPGTARPPRQDRPPPPQPGPMTKRLVIRDGETAEERFAVVTGDSGQPGSRLAEVIRASTGATRVYRGASLLAEPSTVEELGLVDGEVLTLDHPGEDPAVALPAPATPLQLRVVGGPDAGHAVDVGDLPVTVGRAADNALVLRDRSASRHHAVLTRDEGGAVVRDLGSENGLWVEGRLVESAALVPGEVVRIGDSLLQLVRLDPADEVQLEAGHGFAGLHRRFRTGLADPPDKVRFPRPPSPGDPPAWNVVMALLPGAGIIAMAFLFGRPQLAVFAIMSPLLSIGRTLQQRKAHREKVARLDREHREALARAEEELEAARVAERHHRRALASDAARAVQTVARPDRDLWSRRATDPDALALRVGAADADSEVAVDRADRDTAPPPARQAWLPVVIDLPRLRGLALVGELEQLRPLGCSLVLQAAVLHAPAELQIVFLGGPESEAAWSWLRWLPHLRRSREDTAVAIGTDGPSRAARIEELRRLVAARRDAAGPGAHLSSTPQGPLVLLVCDDASARIAEGAAEVMRDGPAVGIHTLALDRIQVPEGCDSSVTLGARPDRARVERLGEPPLPDVIADAVAPWRCEQVARRLAGIQLVGEDGDEGLPASCRLLTTLGVEARAEAVAERWRQRSPSTSAVIGVGAEGPLRLDLTRDGPHALVAGTTRAGKSEFIKTLVASLALENSPDDLAFLFIDFKGGGDYQTLQRLPHAVALTTSLDDPAAFERALTMLDAELARRQRMVLGVNAATIEGYHAVPGGPPAPLPRLLVVVDEFAELKDRQPKQLDRLVSVARTGGAFGLHLLLATQRPAGVVTSQIDANVGLRVCFRVKDEQESKEILLGAPDAGRIAERHRGRCFLRSAAAPLTEVQTARVAGARPGAESSEPIALHWLGWDQLGRTVPRGIGVGEVPDPDTDLWDVVAACRAAADAVGWAGQTVPWPAELPDRLPLSSLPPAEDDGIPLALVDDPARQRQRTLTVGLGRGHVVVAGSGRTGRSTALRTFLAGLVRRHGPDEAQVVALDWGGGALLPLELAPHCIGLAMEDLDRAEALLDALDGELAERRERFATRGWSDLPSQHRAAAAAGETPLPWLVLVVDGWDNLAEEGVRKALPQRVAALLARGTPQGLQAVLAGDRGTTQSIVARHLTHRYSLRFNRVVDAEMQGLLARDLPAHQPPGRALEVPGRRLLHVATLDDPGGLGEAGAFQQVMAEAAARAAEAGARRAALVDRGLPPAVPMAAVLGEGPPPGLGRPLLVGLQDAPRRAAWVDLDASGGWFFVTGPPGSGKTTALAAMGTAAAAGGAEVRVVAPPESPLLVAAAHHGWAIVPPDARAGALDAATAPLVVLVDDLHRTDGPPLLALVGAAAAGRSVVAAADLAWFAARFTGLSAPLRAPKAGLVLCPASVANGIEVFSRMLDRSVLEHQHPGRGVLGRGEDTRLVQVPLPDPLPEEVAAPPAP